MSDYMSTLTLEVVQPAGDFHYYVVYFRGTLDKAGLETASDQLEALVNDVQGDDGVIFHFESLDFINSQGIGFLLMLHTRLVRQNKKLIVVGAPDQVHDVLDVVGLLQIIDYYDSLEAFRRKG